MKTAFVFLTRNAKQYTQYIVDLFNEPPLRGGENNFTVISINSPSDETLLLKNGFINCTKHHTSHVNKQYTAIDKALYIYSCIQKEYSHVWLIEDDVFIPSLSALLELNNNCKEYDLCVSRHKKLSWYDAYGFEDLNREFEGKLFRSMTCAVRLSRKMLDIVSRYAEQHKTLFYHELMFNTLAHKNNCSVYTPTELRPITWEAKWTFDDYFNLSNHLFHPNKDFENHSATRLLIAKANEIGYKPNQKTNPIFLSQYQKSL